MTRATSTMPAASASSRTSRAENLTTSSRQGLKILDNLDHRGAVGADPLVGDGAGCLIQMPDALLARLGATKPASRCREPAAMPSPCASCRATTRPATYAIEHFEHFVAKPKARRCSAGATCRPTPTGLGKTRDRDDAGHPPGHRRRRAPSIRDQDAFERKILAIRKQMLNNICAAGREARSARRCANSTCRRSRPGPSSTRACCWRRRSAASTRICRIR